MSDSEEIRSKIDRLEAIAEMLENGEVDLATAKELRQEADEHLKQLRDQLDVGDGEIIELETD